jgi:hypothetical protein
MICHYCNQEKGKLCKAHIIPESFYRFMYPNGKVEGHSLFQLNRRTNYVYRNRVGVYDDTILCSTCDGLIGKLDKHGADIFLDSTPTRILQKGADELWEFENADYTTLKLFILSMLWRASISHRNEFDEVYLPEKFSIPLREMILNNNSGGLNDFSVVISQYHYIRETNNFEKLILLPKRFRLSGINYYSLLLPKGFQLFIKVDSRPQPEDLIGLTLQKDMPIYIFKCQFFEKTNEFKKILEQVRNSHK